MKATEIKITLQKTDEWNDKVWIGASYTIEDGETVAEVVKAAKIELESAYLGIQSNQQQTTPQGRVELLITSPDFQKIVKRGKVNLTELQKHYIISAEAMQYFETNKLI